MNYDLFDTFLPSALITLESVVLDCLWWLANSACHLWPAICISAMTSKRLRNITEAHFLLVFSLALHSCVYFHLYSTTVVAILPRTLENPWEMTSLQWVKGLWFSGREGHVLDLPRDVYGLRNLSDDSEIYPWGTGHVPENHYFPERETLSLLCFPNFLWPNNVIISKF